MEDDSISTGARRTELPNEVIHIIIDQLQDEESYLKMCSLVSKQFVSRAQKHLFCTIELLFPQRFTHHPARALLDIFDINPSLARHVENLDIVDYFEGVWDSRRQEYHKMVDEILPRLFRHFLCLRSFSLVGAPALTRSVTSTDRKHLHDLSPHLMSALFQMFRSNKVTDIALESITNFPMDHLASTCPHLQRLSLESLDSFSSLDTAVLYGNLVEIQTQAANRGLQALKFDDGSALAAQKLCEGASRPGSCLTLAHLQSLVLHGHSESMREAAAQIIVDAASFLEEFHWDHNFHVVFADFHSTPIDLGVTMNLRVLRWAGVHAGDEQPDHLYWIYESLSGIQEHNRLEEIVIVLFCHLSDIQESEWGESADWAASFDSLLASPKFGFLRRVVIFVDFSNIEDRDPLPTEEYVRIDKCLEDRLPLLRERGVLSIDWIVSDGSEGGLAIAERMLDHQEE
ncbi:hypothetical protein Hypma_004265 [Hypsizygus marmoreus]|uniref:F-box domain-containing protein n=1 Tax=Hypsizygus marmoreus TaxID=39966 RepID=A0A369J536_HYPMA|nr:hypothetical protein Hypma_004265 [Hypsizygus marmoreus]